MTAPRTTGRDGLSVDRLGEAMVAVIPLRGAAFGADGPRGVREPHRHDFHELLWTERGEGEHSIDGERTALTPGTVTVIGRGQVHVMERARDLHGAVVRFREEMLADGGPGWLLHAREALSAPVPPSESSRLSSLVDALDAELARPADGCSVELQRHLLSAILLLVQRWLDGSRAERPDLAGVDTGLYRRFVAQLDRDYARHHDAAHYAESLGVPGAALARALAAVTGRSTKELVTDRVMLEASRLLLFTDLTIGEIAYRIGFRDQLYFSRAFKRHAGAAPSDYRAAVRRR